MTSKEEKIAKAISEILVAIGEDPERTGLTETPKRVSKSILELCSSTNREFKNYKVFKENVDNNLIMVGNIDFYSLCEHHML
ncbi:MAG: GTP cyclohydrolase I, partial [Firmicutes bacterium]|nr:GTP cyclohydrolase I [Candidatus Gallilactobacillus intestinavium]